MRSKTIILWIAYFAVIYLQTRYIEQEIERGWGGGSQPERKRQGKQPRTTALLYHVTQLEVNEHGFEISDFVGNQFYNIGSH